MAVFITNLAVANAVAPYVEGLQSERSRPARLPNGVADY